MHIERIQRGLSQPWAGGAVPVPNAVLDVVMPTLRDTEMRVLLVVIRATLGWQERGVNASRRKLRDRISHSQMCRRTGRASAAVSSAVDSLVRKGLVCVEDAAGRPLVTPEERRRYLGQQFFRPIGFALGITPQIGGEIIRNAGWEKRKQQKKAITK